MRTMVRLPRATFAFVRVLLPHGRIETHAVDRSDRQIRSKEVILLPAALLKKVYDWRLNQVRCCRPARAWGLSSDAAVKSVEGLVALSPPRPVARWGDLRYLQKPREWKMCFSSQPRHLQDLALNIALLQLVPKVW